MRALRLPRVALVLAATLVACSVPFVGGGGGRYELVAYFPRAVSVFPSSDVRVLGLPAGSVSDVIIEGDKVRIEMSIPDDIKVPADGFAQIVPQSLIGERYIQLSPAFKEGMEAAKDGHVIDLDHTITPVEPDEALAAIKKFLDSLDPNGLGDLVTTSTRTSRATDPPSTTRWLALRPRVDLRREGRRAGEDRGQLRPPHGHPRDPEQQLGSVLDAFAEASQVLADERQSIEELVAGLANLSQEGLALVGEHATELRTDIGTLTDAAATIEANLASVDQLLDAGGLLTAGLEGAYDPESRSINLRNNFSPLVPELIELLLGQLGLPLACMPALGCSVSGTGASAATPARITASPTPIGSFLSLLAAPGVSSARGGRSVVEAGGDLLGDAIDTLLGVGS